MTALITLPFIGKLGAAQVALFSAAGAATVAVAGAAAVTFTGITGPMGIFENMTIGHDGAPIGNIDLADQKDLINRLREAFTDPKFDLNNDGTVSDGEITRAFVKAIIEERGEQKIPDWLKAVLTDPKGNVTLVELLKHDGITFVPDKTAKSLTFGFGYDTDYEVMGRQRKEAVEALAAILRGKGDVNTFAKEMIDLFNSQRHGVIAIPPGKIDADQLLQSYAKALHVTRPEVDLKELRENFDKLGLDKLAKVAAVGGQPDYESTNEKVSSFLERRNRDNVVQQGLHTYLADLNNLGVKLMTNLKSVQRFLPGVDSFPPSSRDVTGTQTNLVKPSPNPY